MSISKDIHQREFRTEYQKTIINIFFTHNYLIDVMSGVFKNFDITRQQYNVLRILRGQYPRPATINLIKDRMLDKMSDTSRIVERLRLKGLITRADSRNDKRAVEIRITDAGLSLLDKMQTDVDNLESYLHTLTPEETHQLNQLLDKLRGSQNEILMEDAHDLELVHQHEKF